MNRLILICAYFILGTTVTETALSCPSGEVENDCPRPCDTYCPTSESQVRECQATASHPQCPPASCECSFNSRRNATGQCISTSNCPPFPCPRNQRFVACPPLCPTDDCAQATPDGRCPLPGNILIVVECSPECRCIEGYWKNNGICVPYSNCRNVKLAGK